MTHDSVAAKNADEKSEPPLPRPPTAEQKLADLVAGLDAAIDMDADWETRENEVRRRLRSVKGKE